jgi:cyclophilin family peptidyl-prolyl cis-trans isomerase
MFISPQIMNCYIAAHIVSGLLLGGIVHAQIFADFETSMGDFTCELDHAAAPKAVANFVGLATGERAWIDPATGAVRGDRFYDGLTFHRVVSGFMSQAGSPNGLGTDGPGYTFRDEADNGLLHDSAYVLSMANAGPHTNGSQFFITAAVTANLDGLHTVFGRATSGHATLDAINTTPTDANARPVVPVVIHRVGIRRVGEAAEAFDIHAQGVPVCRPVTGRLGVAGMGQPVEFLMNEAQPSGSEFIVYQSADMKSWTRLGSLWQYLGGTGFQDINFGPMSAQRRFYHVSLVEYPDAMGFQAMANLTIDIAWPGNEMTFVLDGTGTAGTAEWRQPAVADMNITDAWIDDPYSLYETTFILLTDNHGPWGLNAVFDSREPGKVLGKTDVFRFSNGWVFQGSGDISVVFP